MNPYLPRISEIRLNHIHFHTALIHSLNVLVPVLLIHEHRESSGHLGEIGELQQGAYVNHLFRRLNLVENFSESFQHVKNIL